MARYGEKAEKTVESAMRRRKKGTLRSGRSRKKVTSRKQAIAIGLSEARSKGAKVPPRAKSRTKRTGGSRARRKTTSEKKRARSRTSTPEPENAMKIESLQNLFAEQLKDVYGAEKQILSALPKMVEAASSSELKNAHRTISIRPGATSSASSRSSSRSTRSYAARSARGWPD